MPLPLLSLTTTALSMYLTIFAVELVLLYPLFAWVKWQLMVQVGMSRQERQIVFSNRTRRFDLDYLIARYGARRLRTIDGLSRKLLHIVAGFWQLAVLNFIVKDTEVALIAAFLYQIFILMLRSISYSSNKVFGLAWLMDGASSRIRDGIYGRKNLFAARCSFLSLIPLAIIDQVARQNVSDPTDLVLFSFFVSSFVVVFLFWV